MLYRPKMGFTVPTAAILKAARDLYFDATASLAQTEFAEIVSLPEMEATYRRFLDGDDSLALRCWTHFVLATWLVQNAMPQRSSRPEGSLERIAS